MNQRSAVPESSPKRPLAAAAAKRTPPDIRRILELPIAGPITSEESEEISRVYIRPKYFGQGFRLLDRQAEAISAFEIHGCLMAPIGVGHGKTGTGLLCANSAMKTHGHKRVVLMQPPNTVPQLVKRDLPFWRARVELGFPVHNLHGRGPKARMHAAKRKMPGLYIFPYSLLSAPDAEDVLEAVDASMFILDECHSLKDQRAARTGRFMRYIANRDVKMVIMSGTMTDRRLADYEHLATASLDLLSPLPVTFPILQTWASFLDADAPEPQPQDVWKMAPLLNWYQANFPGIELQPDQDSMRRAFRVRLTTSPAVVASADDEIGVSLYLDIDDPKPEGAPDPIGWEKLQKLQKQVDVSWLTPYGDEIDYAIHKWRHLYELSAGFYYDLRWPEDADSELLERSQEHHFLKQEYARMLREYFKHPRPRLDTPMLVGNSFARFGNDRVGNAELYEAWQMVKAAESPDLIERTSRGVRVCSYKVDRAAEMAARWQASKQGGILWYHHQEVGNWLVEKCQQLDLNVLHCPAGNQHNVTVIDPQNANRIVIASIRAHGEGKNLQHHHNTYFVQNPRQAKMMQQAVGRTHRKGQKEDELVVYFSLHGEFDDLQLAHTLVDAVYQHTTLGAKQKVVDGNWLTDPRIFPPQLLRQRGLECRALNDKEEAAFRDKFGNYV